MLKKLWFPTIVVAVAAAQTFGMDAARAIPSGIRESISLKSTCPDTVIYDNSGIFTPYRGVGERVEGDTTDAYADSLEEKTPSLTARDTIHPPDSLKYTDPFRYKYYVALIDSLTHVIVRDSLKAAGDSIDWPRIDSIYYADSAYRARLAFLEWYNSLDKAARKKYDFDQKMKRKQAELDSIYNIKDSLLAIRDSIREFTPRILSTFAIPEENHYERIITWNRDILFNEVKLQPLDTTYNYWFNDYPFMREDVNASYLGIAGSPVQSYDFFKRKSAEGVPFYAPYESWSYSSSTVPMYNTKTPYTELAYWGTLFANTEREESEVHIMTTQNIWPALNLRLEYNRYGANGMLDDEDTDNRTFVTSGNYMGKRYLAHAGYISNKIEKSENGGLVDSYWIRDTTVGSREINVHLTDADNLTKKKTFFLDQTYRIPFNFINNIKEKRIMKAEQAYRDSVVATGDSLAIEKMEKYLASLAAAREEQAVMEGPNTDITTAFIGHNSEYSVYTKVYTDYISASNEDGRDFYNNTFYLNPTTSRDSMRVSKLENKVFIKLQPWSSQAIVSNLNAGIGNRILSHYLFQSSGYLTGPTNSIWNSTYLYGGVGGKLRKNLDWSSNGYFTFLGTQIGDFGINADATLSLYPFRRYKNSPITFKAHFETCLEEPDYYEQHFYSNHYRWENDFDKKSVTKVEASLSIPHLNFSVEGGYSLLDNNIYYGTDALPAQNTTPMSVVKLKVKKDFKLWMLHFDNSVLIQKSSNETVMPLPLVSANLKWFVQLDVVKSVMQMQIGAHTTYTTSWYAPAYNPVNGQFFNQTDEKYGDCPYIDVFVNVQWKRACIFVKLINANLGWPMDRPDYFSAAGYIRPQRSFKFGILWPFYLQPGKSSGSVQSSGIGSRPSGMSY